MRSPVIAVMAAKEMRDAARSRWLAGFIATFLVLGGALMLAGSMSSAFGGSAGFGRTTAALVNLVLLVVPLMGLTAGALALSLERERGTLEGLLALPVKADELFWAKFAGLAGALSAAVALSFGLLGLGLAARGGFAHAAAYAGCLAATWLLALISLALGLLLSARARRVATALGWALLLWLVLVFAGDLGLLGTSLAVRLRPGVLLAAAWLNPPSLYRLLAIDASAAGLEMLGPAGHCAQDILGGWLRPAAFAGLLAWLGAALAAALALFRRDPVGRGA